MNSGDRILELQESERAIELLAAQREMYSIAKRWNAVWTFVCLGVPLAITLLQIWVELPGGLVFLAVIAVLALGLIAESVTARYAREAPAVQQELDAYLYGVDFDLPHYDSSAAKKCANRHLRREGARGHLSRWYSVPLQGVEAGKAIASCQRQNASWSESLASRYGAVGVAAAALVAAIVVAMVCAAHASWESLAFLPAVLEWFCRRCAKASTAKKKTKFLVQAFDRWSHTDLDDIKETQKAILEYRLDTLLVPNWFYKRCRKRDEGKTAI